MLHIATFIAFAEEPAKAASHDYIESIKNLFEIAAIVVGGFWTYLNYIRGRTYKSRLEPSITCRAEKGAARCHLVALVQLKCVGLSRVPIDQHGTALIMYFSLPRAEADVTESMQVRWSRTFSAVDVFTNHAWIEAGEVISEQLMIELPKYHAHAYRIKVKINSGRYSWTTVTTVNVEEDCKGV
ncbi:MAG: hypothetical protein WAN65_23920 [Candidatus Sulfotelmatobacter sp.]